MDHTESPPLLIQKLARWAADAWNTSRLPFLASLVFGLLAHTFAFTNKLLNHDETSQLFAKGATVSSGRWGLGFLDVLLPNYSMPWIYGILTLVLIALAICIIVQLFSIRSRIIQVLLAGSIIAFPSLTGLFGYMFTSSAYAVSFFCAVASVWCIRQGKLLYTIPALMLLVSSVSIYQGYVSTAAGLLVVLLIQGLLRGDEAVPVLKRGIGYVLFLVTALAGYYIATQVLFRLLGIGFNEYAADAVTFRVSDIPKGIVTAYRVFGQFFTLHKHALVPTAASRTVHDLLFAACGFLLLLWLRRQSRKDACRIALLAVLIAVLPLAINCMYMITAPESIHTLVLYSFVCLYVLAAVIMDTLMVSSLAGFREQLRRGALNLAAIAMALIIAINTYVANEAYLNLHLRYENAYAFYSALVSDLKQLPEFQEGTRLAVVGTYQDPDFYQDHFPFLSELTGVKGFLPDSYSYNYFLEYYIGVPVPIASQEEIAQIQTSQDFLDMSTYPYYGSTKVINGIIVVKLS